jgi:hypothetical protein
LKKIITVDWDDTLVLYNYDSSDVILNPSDFRFNEPLIEELKELKKGGCEIHVVTFRGQTIKHFAQGFDGTEIELNLLRIENDYGLSINKIHYTNGACKTSKLKELNSIRHYDDSTQVCCMVAVHTETWPILVNVNRKEQNSFLDELVRQGRVTVWPGGREKT